MALKKDKTKILLPRREVLLKGGLGALGMAIGATALPFKGAWAMDSSPGRRFAVSPVHRFAVSHTRS